MKNMILFSWLFMSSALAFSADSTDSLMNVYKSELQKQQAYDHEKEHRITKLKAELAICPVFDRAKQYHLTDLLYQEYFSYQHDQAIVYSHQLIKVSSDMHDLAKLNESRVKLGLVLLLSDMFKEASDCIKSIDPRLLNSTVKVSYYELNYTFYRSLLLYTSDRFYVQHDSLMEVKYLDSAIAVAKPNSFEQLSAIIKLPDTARQRKTSEYLLYHTKLSPHHEAMIASYLSRFYSGKKAKDLLLLAAIDDIRTSTKETLAASLLGGIYNQENDIKTAYLFLQNAQDDARFFGSRIHEAEVATLLPYVAAKNLLLVEREKQHFQTYLLIVVAAAIITALIAFIIFFQLKNLKAKEVIIRDKNDELEKVNGKLWESSRIKEEFIGLFFKTCSSYIETLDRVKRKAQHSIKLGKYTDASAILSDIHIEREKDELYRTLDRILLTLFPNFISSFNALLKKEDQILPKAGETLTATLRIFALIRLGVSDIDTIAKILDYSVSTVYTYKVRVKAKALVPADDFEQKVMEIKFIDQL